MPEDAAGLADPAYSVPPVRSRSTRRFGAIWLLTPLVWAACLPFVTFGWINRYDSGEASFVEGLYERKTVALRRAAERSAATGKPRLVVVGGSGALLGIDAELIGLKLGVPCVNLATHAGLGGEYLLDRARRELRPGDRVLLAPEYQLWSNPQAELFNDLEWEYACTYDKRFLLGLDRGRLAKLMYSVPLADYGRAAAGWLDRARGKHFHTRPGYNLATLSPAGDLRAALPRANFGANPGYPFPDVRTASRVGDFRRFSEWAKANGVRVFFTWPNGVRPDLPVPPGGDVPPAEMTALLNELGFTVLDTPAQTAYPRAWYTDTAYHTDACCRRLRTEQLVRRLRPHVGLPPAPEQPTGYYLISSPTHRPNDVNAFADDPGVSVKYLADGSVDHPDAVTPAQVATLVGSGRPVYFDEPEMGRVLLAQGLRAAEVTRTSASFADWALRTYGLHILLIVRPGGARTQSAPSLARDFLAQPFAGTAPFVVVMGTGPYNSVSRAVVGGAGGAKLRIDLRSLTGRDVPQLAMDLNAPSSGTAEVRVNREVRASAPPGTGAVAVVVIDPELGTVVDAATFAGATDADLVTRQLWKLVSPN
jgi:hypothetical protein